MPGEDPRPSAKRVSIACIPCRTRHIKCDATRPHCRRCSSYGKECYYERSRRGGLDREALAARRGRESRDTESSGSSGLTGKSGSLDKTVAGEHRMSTTGSWQPLLADISSSVPETGPITTFLDSPFHTTSSGYLSVGTVNDPLIDLYYKHFHGFHPCLLPQRHLHKFLQDPTKRAYLEPLLRVIRFIGSIYGGSTESLALKERAKKCDSDLQCHTDPLARAFKAQSRLLLSIALYWSTDMEESRLVLNRAIRDAFDLGMNRREFAPETGTGDPVLEESLRRTWWQLYIVDAYYAAIKRTPKFLTQEVESTVDLPCEEEEYESGSIPVPKTLEDFDSREFATDDYVYSSFAYQVGSIRCIASVTALACEETSPKVSEKGVEAADTIAEGWFLLLPESKRQVMGKEGIVDELMFQAHMGLHAAIVGLHRPYSNLLYNPLEIISSCATGAPDSVQIGDLVNVHTIRCLKSVEAQVRLMALPARPFCHTPFVICMMTAGTIPLLSACKFLFTSQRLEIARHQIRMSIGCLKAMAGTWPQAAVHVRELQTIAQEVLGLSSRGPDSAADSGTNSGSDETSSGTLTAAEPFETQLGGGFPFDSLVDSFQQAWDNLPSDLTCYDFSAVN